MERSDDLTGGDLEAYIRKEILEAMWKHFDRLIIFGGEEGLAQHTRRQYLVSFLRGIAQAADEKQIGDIEELVADHHMSPNVGRLLVNGDLLREAADEFESLFQPSTVETPTFDNMMDKFHIRIIKRDMQQAGDDYHATVTRSDGVQLIWLAKWKWLLKFKTRRSALEKHFRNYDRRQKKLAEVEEIYR